MSDARPSRSTHVARSRLLMIERGAPLVLPRDDDFDETVAISQLAGEGPAEFAERTLRRIALAQKAGRYFAAAELFVGSRHDEPTLAARRRVSLAIAEHARRSQSLSELVTVVGPDADAEARERLVELGDDLARIDDDKPLRLRLRWVEAEP